MFNIDDFVPEEWADFYRGRIAQAASALGY